jgi:hypothetical protein
MPGFDPQLDRDHLLRLDLLELKDLVLKPGPRLGLCLYLDEVVVLEWAHMFPWNLSAHLVPLPLLLGKITPEGIQRALKLDQLNL